MKNYRWSVLAILLGFILVILAGCSNEYNTANDEYVTPEEFVQMNTLASQDGFTYPFTINDVRIITSTVCPLSRASHTPAELGMNVLVALSPMFPTLTPYELGTLSGYVARFACYDDAMKLAGGSA